MGPLFAFHKPVPCDFNIAKQLTSFKATGNAEVGYCNTTGINNMDYLIADKTVIPDSCRKFYSEKIIYMPNTFMPGDDTQKISEKKLKRKDFGIPNNAVIYCCFNKSYKITPEIFNIWINIINEVENSILWLNISNDQTKLNIINYAKKMGLNSNKIFVVESGKIIASGKHEELLQNSKQYKTKAFCV